MSNKLRIIISKSFTTGKEYMAGARAASTEGPRARVKWKPAFHLCNYVKL